MRKSSKQAHARRIAILSLLPMILLVVRSFALRYPFPDLLPERWSARGWVLLWTQHRSAIAGSLALGVCTAVLAMALVLPAAVVLARRDFRGKSWLEWLLFLPMLLPATPLAMGIHRTFLRLGLAGHFAGVVLADGVLVLPYTLRMLKAIFVVYDSGAERVAINLGMRPLRAFIQCTLRPLRTALLPVFAMSFIVGASEYFLCTLVGHGKVPLLPAIVFPLVESGDRTLGASFGLGFLAMVLFVVVPAVLYAEKEASCFAVQD